jgi:sugar lactone lactonase YvrE
VNRLYSIALPLVIASSGAIPTIPIPTLGAPSPLTSGIVALEDGTVFFVDSFSETVWRYQPGNALTAFVSGRNGRVLCADDDGHLYGTHEDESGRVTTWRADERGSVVDLAQTEVPQYGHAFVVEDDGGIIASSGTGKRTGVRLVRTEGHSHELVAGGEMGFRDGAGRHAQFFPIGGMTRTPDGDLLVTSGTAIRRVTTDGTVHTIAKGERLLKPRHAFFARLFGQMHGHLTSIAVGQGGEIYVANSARNAVIRIGTNGSADEIVKTEDGWTPTGVSTANGSLYILEYGRGVRVRRVDANGDQMLIAQVRPDRAVAAAVQMGRFQLPG